MCGIVGYVGEDDAKEVLLAGLEKLEYRGYDSAGVALSNESGVHIFKQKGRIHDLRAIVDPQVDGRMGIGHTRWATHGRPSTRNAHPHHSGSKRFCVVHNGVIDNYEELKRAYLADVTLLSDTDTEVIVHLVEHWVESGFQVEDAFRITLQLLQGSYAIALLDSEDKETLYVGKNKSPLLIGIGDGFRVVASDAMAALQLTNRFVELMDEEMVLVRRNSIAIHNVYGDAVLRDPFRVELNAEDIEKGPYAHYMLKEIDEQPSVIRKLASQYRSENGELELEYGVRQAVLAADRIYMIACGTSYHAGLVGKQLLERIAGIPVEAHVASEFLYNRPVLSARPLFMIISQSGETADSRGVLVDIKKLGHTAITITNVPGSTLSREADYTLLTHAGPEIAVASTKAYTAQIAVLALLAVDSARQRGVAVDFDPMQALALAANAMEIVIGRKEKFEEIVWEYLSDARSCFFIGRGLDYYVGLEGALKLKEISYIQAEGFAAGELKHGTIALIEEGTPVVALLTQARLKGNIRSNVQEVLARGARVCMISSRGMEEERDAFILPEMNEAFAPLVSVIPLQLIAYYAALFRGCDVDKPRNLAKSVTVE